MASDSKATVTVVEHTVFFKFRDGYTEEQEMDMYKGLWSFKDYFPSIMCMSLGCVLAKEPHGVTHVLVMRFASREALATYLADDYRIDVSRKTITPFQSGEYSVDYEADVDTDLSQLYKEGEKFNDGVDHAELFTFKEGTSSSEVEEFMNFVADLPNKLQTDIVQLTSGTNYKPNDVFTHAFVVRLPSVEALDAFVQDPAYVDMHKKGDSIFADILRVNYTIGESKKKILEESAKESSKDVDT
ncbi:unnamed protein product [Calypogeia fissa]